MRTAPKSKSILQVVLLRNESASQELGQLLWATLEEVRLLYDLANGRGTFSRIYVAQTVPESVSNSAEVAEVLPLAEAKAGWGKLWAPGEQSRRTIDANVLAVRTQELLGQRAASKILSIVTDQEITPPPQWRYVIWGGDATATVISTAPIDPRYWGIQTNSQARLQTIKQRVRAACCCVAGAHLDLERCENPQCFMYSSVDSVTNLDEMICIGREHGIPELTGMGFKSLGTESNSIVGFARKLGLVKGLSASDVQEPESLKSILESEASA